MKALLFALMIITYTLTASYADVNPRKNEPVVTSANKATDISIATYYSEDAKLLLQTGEVRTPVEDFYLAEITLKKNSDGTYNASYYGPLYAQCTGGSCAAQGYGLHLDSCGNIVAFDLKQTTLQTYDPREPDSHVPVTPEELNRIQFYSNNPTIMRNLYDDIAGADLKSNYILGNSIPVDLSMKAPIKKPTRTNPQIKDSGTRWGLNPWGTNTAATFFIHLDMIRKTLAKTAAVKTCPEWPKFNGQTPLPKEDLDISKLKVASRILIDAQFKNGVARRRLANFESELLINRVARECNPTFVSPFESALISVEILLPKLLATLREKDTPSHEINRLQKRISELPDDARAVFISLKWLELDRQTEVKNAEALARISGKKPKSDSEKQKLLTAFLRTVDEEYLWKYFGTEEVFDPTPESITLEQMNALKHWPLAGEGVDTEYNKKTNSKIDRLKIDWENLLRGN